ncbi:amino acid racemase [Vibrio sp. TH_r3]|uniref:aspartate/glutamate racemase family protein n=1 Tax=Vibrio sp. TH_r3 TaxID=3082084 RepID=UPI002952C6DC|nr:amino acid racemase [Vibrio sp. TH_r3]MDV7104963.1 amino acid racemase [Vibrio sp. TH_r3]
MNKKLGVLGGMGPMATVDFVRRIVEKSPASSDQEHMAMIISNDPVIPDRTKHIMENGENPLTKMLNNLMTLRESGATKVVIPCNTAHYWLDKLSADEKVSFISIIEAVMSEASRRHMSKVGVLATNATIQTGIYTRAIESRSMTAILPTDPQQQQVMQGIYSVKSGKIEQGREMMEPVFDDLIARGAEGVVLGCTEIPIAFDHFCSEKKSRALDSLDILADQCVKYYYYEV